MCLQANGWAMMAGLGSIAVMMGLYSKIGTSRAVPAAPLQSVALAAMSGDKPEGFGASHTSFYTSVTAKDSYATLDEILNAKMADAGVRGIVKEVLLLLLPYALAVTTTGAATVRLLLTCVTA